MKKSTYFLICFISILTFQSCSTVKVLDSWKSDNVSDLKNRNFLVVARSANDQTRLVFENEIIKQMESNGYRVTSSFAKFGNMNPNEKPSESNNGMIKKMLESEGFDGVVLTVLKDLKEETRLQKEGGYYAGGNYCINFDNAAIHHEAGVQRVLAIHKMDYLFSGPYSYMCQAIEMHFAKVRTHVEKSPTKGFGKK